MIPVDLLYRFYDFTVYFLVLLTSLSRIRGSLSCAQMVRLCGGMVAVAATISLVLLSYTCKAIG